MEAAAQAFVMTLTVVGALTVGVALGMAWLYLRGELQVSLTRVACNCDATFCAAHGEPGLHERL
jgi:hypothetical protein